MTKICRFFLLLLMISTHITCGEKMPLQHIGTWQAFEIWEDGSRLSVDSFLIDVVLQLREDNSYSWYSTLKYQENGTYSVRDNVLTTQTEAQLKAKQKRVMEIEVLTGDTLQLRMQEKGKAQTLIFCKL